MVSGQLSRISRIRKIASWMLVATMPTKRKCSRWIVESRSASTTSSSAAVAREYERTK